MRDDSRFEVEEHLPYGRPSVSAWIAAVAVAFAVFVLGGFIKTYRQLETLRDESRREIRELRQSIDGVRVAAQAAPHAAQTGRLPSLPPLPPASRLPQSSSRAAALPSARQQQDKTPLREAAQRLFPEMEDTGRGVTYEFGRKSDPGKNRLPQCQVISVAGPQRRVIIEGGRNSGLSEGLRLELSRGGRWIGDLRIIEVYDSMAACEVLHATLPPQPGDAVRLP